MNFLDNTSSSGGSPNSLYARIGSCAEYGSGSFTINNLSSGSGGGGAGAGVVVGTASGSSATTTTTEISPAPRVVQPILSRYESQKRRDWNTFNQYLRNHRPPLPINLCSGAHVLEFLRYLDQFGKTKVHNHPCPYFGVPNPPSPCPCPLRQAWGSLDALVGRLRAAYEEHGGRPETNPFGARAVRLYLREVREYQAKARGVSYEKKRKRLPPKQKPVEMALNTE